MIHRRFSGIYSCPLDEKDRVVVPMALRKEFSGRELEEGLVVTMGFEGSLMVYVKDQWDRMVERFSRLPPTSADARLFGRLFISPATTVPVDRVGRISLTQAQKELGGIERMLSFHGMGSYIELWSPERWSKYVADSSPKLSEVAERIAPAGIWGEAVGAAPVTGASPT